jgi:hypothetical protein
MTKEEKKKLVDKQYREANKERIKAWRDANKNKIKESNKAWRDANKEYKAKLDKNYKQKNASKIKEQNKVYNQNNKTKHNAYRSNRRKTDPLFKLTLNTRALIRLAIKRNGFNKKSKTADILGCSYEEFKIYIESKFESWMNWGNSGLYNGTPNYGWDIDHIIPLSSAKTEQELIKLCHYTNTQPLCSKVNRDIKKASI